MSSKGIAQLGRARAKRDQFLSKLLQGLQDLNNQDQDKFDKSIATATTGPPKQSHHSFLF